MNCTVILPTYNSEIFIRDTLDSIFSQSYKKFYLIAYDDASTDTTPAIIKEYMRKHNNIMYFCNKKNMGVGHTLSSAFKKTVSKYIAMIGHDDIWESNYLEEQIGILKRTNALVSFSNVILMDFEKKKYDDYIFNNQLISNIDRYELFSSLIKGNYLCAPSSVINRHKLNKEPYLMLGGNNDRLQDYELWLNLLMSGSFIYNELAVCFYRIHENNYSKSNKKILQGKYEYVATLRRILFCSDFLLFLKSYEQPSKIESNFLLLILNNLESNISYSKSIIPLITEFCEYLVCNDIRFDFIYHYMSKYYNSMGLLTKTKTNFGGKLYDKVKVFLWAKDEVVIGLLDNNYFEVVNSIDDSTIILVEDQFFELAINDDYVIKAINGEKCLFFSRKETAFNFNKFLICLSLSSTFSERLISYIEDNMFNIFSSELYLSEQDWGKSSIYTNFIRIKKNDSLIRKITFFHPNNTFSGISFYSKCFEKVPFNKDSHGAFSGFKNTDLIIMEHKDFIENSVIKVNNDIFIFSENVYEEDKKISEFVSFANLLR